MPTWQSIEASIGQCIGHSFSIQQQHRIRGGSINRAYRIDADIDGAMHSYFVKFNQASQVGMFEAEADGLRELADSKTIRVPEPVCFGAAANESWLVTEYIEFGQAKDGSSRQLGRQLAALHAASSERFGWHRDNTIGATPQCNAWANDWIAFYREQRLHAQFELAARNGFTGSLQHKGEQLLQGLDKFFVGYQPQPSLLHGDLWGGNCAVDIAGCPVIFDPAVYYGDREADLAMSELFGGFSADFYASYQESWALDDGYSVRKILYNLYHILNHANLFAGAYAAQAETMIDRLLAEL